MKFNNPFKKRKGATPRYENPPPPPPHKNSLVLQTSGPLNGKRIPATADELTIDQYIKALTHEYGSALDFFVEVLGFERADVLQEPADALNDWFPSYLASLEQVPEFDPEDKKTINFGVYVEGAGMVHLSAPDNLALITYGAWMDAESIVDRIAKQQTDTNIAEVETWPELLATVCTSTPKQATDEVAKAIKEQLTVGQAWCMVAFFLTNSQSFTNIYSRFGIPDTREKLIKQVTPDWLRSMAATEQ